MKTYNEFINENVKARMWANFLQVTVEGKPYLTWYPNDQSLVSKEQSLIIVENSAGTSRGFKVDGRNLSESWIKNKRNKKAREKLIECAIEFNESLKPYRVDAEKYNL